MTQPCDCCDGPHVATPGTIFNRPGLCSIAWRVGSYGTFRETMQARLSAAPFPALAGLRSRAADDPSLALIDSWAVVGDVLTFYQERIANEGYLRTATERLSVLNLARLVGYAPRPGVAASAYLAYLLEKDAAPVEIPKGAKSNTIPDPGQQMQAFETSAPLPARAGWNLLKPRLTAPLHLAPDAGESFLLKGIATGLKPNDPLLIGLACEGRWQLHFVAAVEPDNDNDRTKIVLRRKPAVATTPMPADAFIRLGGTAAAYDGTQVTVVPNDGGVPCVYAGALFPHREPAPPNAVLTGILSGLVKAPALQFAGARQLPRNPNAAVEKNTDTVPQLLAALRPDLSHGLYTAWKSVPPATTPKLQVHALRIQARPFGYNAPPRQSYDPETKRTSVAEWHIADSWNALIDAERSKVKPPAEADHHDADKLFLDNDYDIAPDSFIVIQRPDTGPVITQAAAMIHRALAAYGLSGKTVEIDLPADKPWLLNDGEAFAIVRNTQVFAGSEKLELAEAPIPDDVAGAVIELDGLYDGLKAGRWLIVTGERSDVGAVAAKTDATGAVPDVPASPGVAGVTAAELVMVAAVAQTAEAADGTTPAGDTVHSFLTLATSLAYTYRRDTVTIYGNVIHATHGETRQETLGAGDATLALQTFDLKQAPLTFVSAPSVSGIASTLEVRVNGVQWHEAAAMASLGPQDRDFVTRTDDNDKTSIIFGDGVHGARLPTGPENVKAVYRSGIGKDGNAKAGQIALLNTRPLGVKDVTNPMAAAGGADRETRDQARQNTPLALLALDRLVSIQDYADFSRTFAGIGKAAARRVTDGRRQMVEVAIAGAGDIPITVTSDLYRNLHDALHRFGDPYLPIRLKLRCRAALAIAAKIKVDPDYQWETLEPKIRAALLARFGFERMELGQTLFLSDAFLAIQRLPGVVYVDMDVFDKITDASLTAQFAGVPRPAPLARQGFICVDPDEIAYLVPDVPDTLILQEIKP